MEKSLILVQPEGVQKRLLGNIIERFEKRGFKLIEMKMVIPTKRILEKYYENDKDKPFYKEKVEKKYTTPVVPMVFQGENIVSIAQKMIGDINTIGSINGDFKSYSEKNIIYCSKNPADANKEIAIWFPAEDEKIEVEDSHKKEGKWDFEKIILYSLVGISTVVSFIAGFVLIKKKYFK